MTHSWIPPLLLFEHLMEFQPIVKYFLKKIRCPNIGDCWGILGDIHPSWLSNAKELFFISDLSGTLGWGEYTHTNSQAFLLGVLFNKLLQKKGKTFLDKIPPHLKKPHLLLGKIKNWDAGKRKTKGTDRRQKKGLLSQFFIPCFFKKKLCVRFLLTTFYSSQQEYAFISIWVLVKVIQKRNDFWMSLDTKSYEFLLATFLNPTFLL